MFSSPRLIRAALGALFVIALTACGGPRASVIGQYDGSRIVGEKHPLTIDLGAVGPEWLLDNTQPYQGNGRLVGKLGKQYQRNVKFDVDGDGAFDLTEEIRRYEVLLRNQTTDARLSVSVFPIEQQLERTDLTLLARDYVDAASGAGAVEVDWGDERKGQVEKRFASRVLDMELVTVAGYEAIGVTFEVANVDQLQLEGGSRWVRARMLLIRAPWRWKPRAFRQAATREQTWPVMIRVLYTARPEAFERSARSFEKLASGLDFFSDEKALAARAEEVRGCLAETGRHTKALDLVVGATGQIRRAYVGGLTGGVLAYDVPRCLVALNLAFQGTGRNRRVVLDLPMSGAMVPPASSAPLGERWPATGTTEAATSGGERTVASGEGGAPGHPPEPATATAAAPERSIEERLETLGSLRDSGLISEEEYEAKRAAILDSI